MKVAIHLGRHKSYDERLITAISLANEFVKSHEVYLTYVQLPDSINNWLDKRVNYESNLDESFDIQILLSPQHKPVTLNSKKNIAIAVYMDDVKVFKSYPSCTHIIIPTEKVDSFGSDPRFHFIKFGRFNSSFESKETRKSIGFRVDSRQTTYLKGLKGLPLMNYNLYMINQQARRSVSLGMKVFQTSYDLRYLAKLIDTFVDFETSNLLKLHTINAGWQGCDIYVFNPIDPFYSDFAFKTNRRKLSNKKLDVDYISQFRAKCEKTVLTWSDFANKLIEI